MTPEDQLRVMAGRIQATPMHKSGCKYCAYEHAALEAGAQALAITREIAQFEIWELAYGYPNYCRLCGDNQPGHKPDCLYLKCVTLHQGEEA